MSEDFFIALQLAGTSVEMMLEDLRALRERAPPELFDEVQAELAKAEGIQASLANLLKIATRLA